MGFLNDLDLENTEADPDALPDGKYPGFLFSSKIVDKKDQTKSWVIEYKVDVEHDPKWGGRRAQEWYNITKPTEQQKSWLKRRLNSLGVPEDKHGEINPGDVVGIAVTFGIKNKDGYKNVNFVELRNESGTVTTSAAPVQAELM